MDLVSFLTLLTALATFLTVLEMYRQRRASYKPDIIIHNSKHDVYMYRDADDKETTFRFFGTGNTDGYASKFAKLQIVNLGVGVAKNVEIEINFDIEKAIKLIQEKNESNGFTFNLGNSNNSKKEIIYISNKDLDFFHVGEPYRKTAIPFIVTNDRTGSEVYIEIPRAYLALLTIFLDTDRYLPNPKKHEYINKNNFPELEIKINYEDLGGGVYIKNFKAKFLVFTIPNSKKFFDDINLPSNNQAILKFNSAYPGNHNLIQYSSSPRLISNKKFLKIRLPI